MEGWMWTSEQFIEHLQKQHGDEGAAVWYERIVPSMKQQVVAALQSACGAERDVVEGRKRSFEMYGYDFMVDASNNVWLIEVNSSPAMDHSTPVTKALCQEVVKDMFEVLLDTDCGTGPPAPSAPPNLIVDEVAPAVASQEVTEDSEADKQ